VSGHEQAIPLAADTLGDVAERVPTPAYDRRAVETGVVHVGVGGFHRAHQAMYHDELLAAGARDWGICGIGVLPGDRVMRDALTGQDGLYTLVERAGDGTSRARVIGALTEYLLAPDDPEAVIEKLAAPATRIVSMTITEGGYSIHPLTGELDSDQPDIAHDLTPGAVPRSAFGLMTEALDRRRRRGLAPYTVMSCDNLEANGDLTRATLTAFARRRDPELAGWLEDQGRFPNSMVDRITPQTTDADRADVRERFGIEDRWPVVSEPYVQWVLEDAFALGRPRYEDVGVRSSTTSSRTS
jgi:mannitol 2-dehydrogenase